VRGQHTEWAIVPGLDHVTFDLAAALGSTAPARSYLSDAAAPPRAAASPHFAGGQAIPGIPIPSKCRQMRPLESLTAFPHTRSAD